MFPVGLQPFCSLGNAASVTSCWCRPFTGLTDSPPKSSENQGKTWWRVTGQIAVWTSSFLLRLVVSQRFKTQRSNFTKWAVFRSMWLPCHQSQAPYITLFHYCNKMVCVWTWQVSTPPPLLTFRLICWNIGLMDWQRSLNSLNDFGDDNQFLRWWFPSLHLWFLSKMPRTTGLVAIGLLIASEYT